MRLTDNVLPGTTERIDELKAELATYDGLSLTDLSEQEQDDLFFLSEEYYALVGHDFYIEPTAPLSDRSITIDNYRD